MEIYEFDDYRSYLKAAFLRLKKASRIYSLAKLSQKVGCSESFLKKLFAKKTHLGAKHAGALFVVLRLSDEERQYAYFWLLHAQSDDEEFRMHVGMVLRNMRRGLELHKSQTKNGSAPTTNANAANQILPCNQGLLSGPTGRSKVNKPD